jgi:hypothetical protein
MDDYPIYQIDQLLPLASQRLRELGQEDSALNRYKILPTMRQQQLRSHYATSERNHHPHGEDTSADEREAIPT